VSTVAGRLADVRARIERAARACGRDPARVRLVAVSKGQPSEAISAAYEAGQRAFGENYAQELERKARELVALPALEWHFIGHVQTNKAKLIARTAHTVHSVDSEVLARELGKRVAAAGRLRLPVLIEVNVGGEPQKHGARPSEIADVMRAVQVAASLELRGLMTVPPADDLQAARRAFETLASLRSLHGGPVVLPELSMGMSADLEVAVAAGATLVRVGTAVFGPRA